LGKHPDYLPNTLLFGKTFRQVILIHHIEAD
jgi:hypothetical protein